MTLQGYWIDNPIFIVGLQKSGTTLLRNLLDGCQDAVVIPEETQLFHGRFLSPLRRCLAGERREARLPAKVAHLIMTETPLSRLSTSSRTHTVDGVIDYEKVDADLFEARLAANLAEYGAVSLRTILTSVARAVFETLPLYKDLDSAACWFEKTPSNRGRVGALVKAFPNARFIHLLRDPRDNWLSLSRKWPGATIVNVTRSWLRAESAARSHLRSLGDDRYLVIRYEDLVAAPESVMEAIAGFVGITFSSEGLSPTTAGQPWHGNSMFDESHHGIYKGAVGRFRDKAHEEDNELIETIVGGRILDRWNYDTTTKPGSIQLLRGRMMRARFRLGDWWRQRKSEHSTMAWRNYPEKWPGELRTTFGGAVASSLKDSGRPPQKGRGVASPGSRILRQTSSG